jgi:undecaprenyl-diphosphatase
MIETLDTFDKELLLWLNGFHTPFWDTIMWLFSSAPFWIPFYLILLFVILKSINQNWPQQNYKQWIGVIVSISVAILLADQISSGFFKPFFERLRPSHSSDLEGLVHLLSDPNGNIYKGGMYGFVSSHAANSFAIAIFAGYLIKTKNAWIGLILWASLVSYSRIYLGVHYPGDIIGGTIIGVLSGFVAAKLYFFIEEKWVS